MIVYRPQTLAEALRYLQEQPTARLLAGGSDLLPRLNQKLEQQEALCLIGDLPELQGYTRQKDGALLLGAGLTLAALAMLPELGAYPALQTAAGRAASPQIRNQGSLGGNLLQENRCVYFNNAVPWSEVNRCYKWGGEQCFQYKASPRCVALYQSDLAPVLLSYSAELVIVGPQGERSLPLDGLYGEAGAKNLAPGEILMGVRVPAGAAQGRNVYVRKTIRGAFDFPLLSCALWLCEEAGKLDAVRVVFGSAGTRPVELAVTADWAGQPVSALPQLAEAAVKQVRKCIAPFADTRVNGPVRQDLAQAALREAIRDILA